MPTRARIDLDTDDGTSRPNISGDLDDAKEAANQTKFESYRQALNTWFSQLGKKSTASNIQYLEEMSKGIEDMENGFYELQDNEFQLVDLEDEEFWQLFIEVKSYLYGALEEHKKNGMSRIFVNHISTCRRFIHKFVKPLNLVELPARGADAENSGEAGNTDVA